MFRSLSSEDLRNRCLDNFNKIPEKIVRGFYFSELAVPHPSNLAKKDTPSYTITRTHSCFCKGHFYFYQKKYSEPENNCNLCVKIPQFP